MTLLPPLLSFQPSMSAILMMRKIGFLKPVLKMFTYLATFISFVESKYLWLQLILKNDHHASLVVQLRKVCVRIMQNTVEPIVFLHFFRQLNLLTANKFLVKPIITIFAATKKINYQKIESKNKQIIETPSEFLISFLRLCPFTTFWNHK